MESMPTAYGEDGRDDLGAVPTVVADPAVSIGGRAKGPPVMQFSSRSWIRLAFACLGIFGVAFAITGMLVALPKPAAGGTCGPGTGSETAAEALFDPGSIGAGPEPAATNNAAREQWKAFVDECQTTTDDRAIAALVILLLSIGIAVAGPTLVAGRRRREADSPPPVPTMPEPPPAPAAG
jgi:hypothetical protein